MADESNAKDIVLGLAKMFIASQGGPAAALGVAKVAEAIGRLNLGGYFKDSLAKNTPAEVIKDAIARWQRDEKIFGETGLGDRTFDLLVIAKRCLNKLRRTPRKDLDGNDLPDTEEDHENPKKPLEIRYFIVQLPMITEGNELNADKLLQNAWESWSEICGLIATQVTDPNKKNRANVIINIRNIDGPSNILADANVGPPTRSQLTLMFDTAEPWTSDKFQATACHEIGHLLGLEHATKSSQIMSAQYTGTRKIPDKDGEDGEKVRELWGEAPPPIVKPVRL